MSPRAVRRAVAVLCLVLTAPAGAAQKLAIPSYFYPGRLWTQMENAVPTVGLAIIDPFNGPGPALYPNYASQVVSTHAAGITVLGYVYTSYAARSLAEVEADIDTYYGWYALDGIFIDEVNSSCASEPYYATLNAYVKAKGGAGVTVLNPGIPVPECYAAAGDILLTFEGSFGMYQSFTPMGWESGYDPSRFWHLVYATSVDDMPAAVDLSKQRGAGWVYVTQDTLPNPWDTLPANPYWSSELALANLPAADCRPATKPKVTLSKLATPPGDDRLKFTGEAIFNPPLTIDPPTNGVRVVVEGVAGTILDVTIPGGTAWKTSTSLDKWTYTDKTGTGPGAITKVIVNAHSPSIPGRVKLSVQGKNGAYPVTAGDLPLFVQMLLAPSATSGSCVAASYANAGRICTLKPSGTLRCT